MPGFPVQLKELDLGRNAHVINGPINEVQKLGDDVKEGGELLLSIKG